MRSAARRAVVLLAFIAVAPLFAQDQALPKGDQVVDKYIEATGGKAAYEKIHTQVVTGSVTFGAMAIKGVLTVYHAEPGMSLSEIDIQGIGKILEGSDGKVAWSLSAMQGARVKDGEEKAEYLREADLHADTRWREYFTKAETVGVESVEGKPCYKVVLTPKDGSPQTRFYDRESGLLVRTARRVKSPMGEIDVESNAADYRAEGAILVPHKMTDKVGGQEVTMTIDSVKYNIDIPKDKFDLPDEIKALMAKK